MNTIVNEIDFLLLQVKESKDIFNIPENSTLEKLKLTCDASPYMVAIYKLEKYSFSMVDCNKNGCDFLGINKEEIESLGFKYILKIIHPENINSVYRFIKFYNNISNNNKTFSSTFYLNSSRGWEWTYACVKPAIFNEEGKSKYLLAVGCSIYNLLKSKSQFKRFRKDLNFFEVNLEKYLSMTEREKEILKLIADEFTSFEIAEKLSISHYTVDTHRKNLIEKLGVKSSIGLAKFSVLFDIK